MLQYLLTNGLTNTTRHHARSRPRKSSTGQAPILTAILFLVLIPSTVILAQNATLETNLTGDVIDTAFQQTLELPTEPIIPAQGTPVQSVPFNEEAITELLVNETPANEQSTVEDTKNKEEKNIPTNDTEPQQQDTVTPTSQKKEKPAPAPPVLIIEINAPEHATRGKDFSFATIVSNVGEGSAHSVQLQLQLPETFVITSGDSTTDCGIITSGSSCSTELSVSVPESAAIGKEAITAVVTYEQ
jgi:hypothetical protein